MACYTLPTFIPMPFCAAINPMERYCLDLELSSRSLKTTYVVKRSIVITPSVGRELVGTGYGPVGGSCELSTSYEMRFSNVVMGSGMWMSQRVRDIASSSLPMDSPHTAILTTYNSKARHGSVVLPVSGNASSWMRGGVLLAASTLPASRRKDRKEESAASRAGPPEGRLGRGFSPDPRRSNSYYDRGR